MRRLNAGQIDTLAAFFSNMAVAWLVAAFISPASPLSISLYFGYGLVSLYAAITMKGEIYAGKS